MDVNFGCNFFLFTFTIHQYLGVIFECNVTLTMQKQAHITDEASRVLLRRVLLTIIH